MKLKQLDYHRNGVGGYGFHVAIVKSDGEDMLIIRFGDKETDKRAGGVLCAAFNLAKLDQRDIRFFHNSFRGDHYSGSMDKFIKEYPDGKHPDYKIPTEEINA